MNVQALDDALGREAGEAGELLARARARDVIDAALVLISEDGDRILASDPEALRALAVASGRHVEIVRV